MATQNSYSNKFTHLLYCCLYKLKIKLKGKNLISYFVFTWNNRAMDSSINPNKKPLYWKWISGFRSRKDNKGYQIHNELCQERLNLKTANAFLIGKLKTKILLPVWNSHKCILYEQSSPGQALKLKCMVKKKIRKLSHVFSTLQTQ